MFVEGIDRRKETDENGWFQIQVEDRASFTVRAIFEGYVAAAEVKQRKLRESVRLILQPGPSSKPNSDFSLSKTNSDYSPSKSTSASKVTTQVDLDGSRKT